MRKFQDDRLCKQYCNLPKDLVETTTIEISLGRQLSMACDLLDARFTHKHTTRDLRK